MAHRILQIGSGSMGTRRLRDLSGRDDVVLALLETDDGKRAVAEQRFDLEGFATVEAALKWQPNALCISTPPQLHAPFVELALTHGKNFFCEAEIWPYDYREIERIALQKNLQAVPSCTMYFLPLVREVRRIVAEELGTLHAYQMCLSVNERGWHPGQGEEYYARHRSTSAGREMVPFELIALSWMFGEPSEVMGTLAQRDQARAKNEDTWCLQMKLQNGASGQLVVCAASPQIFRTGFAVGETGVLSFNLLSGDVTRQFPAAGVNDTRNFGALSDVMEKVYFEEINAFVETLHGNFQWPFNYRQSNWLTATLAASEKSALTRRVENVRPDLLPGVLPDSYEIAS